ncbi:hypothetical protein [Uliginosibacterium sp. TH139]|uniref:hypothetical protein n=1 Tax=Uliginosibacterium sp. TH139 TaxID=2067453 RepID=UPI000C79CEE0|nr:hypothetical protein [Uliginosibacterium sp. TH139]PLK47996.1 hypothetical protein C0V76_14610 [Uliginosibacterium sp. TH139]
MSTSDSSWRQIALCAWGSQYLAGGNELDDWFRHGVFWEAPQLFRSLPGRTLIAADFCAWLFWLRSRGAMRLTLHATESGQVPAGEDFYWGERLICVHFAEGCERWLTGEEIPGCTDANDAALEAAREASGEWSWVPDPGAYAGDIETWWCLGMGEAISVPETDWSASAARLQAELFPEDGLRGRWRLPDQTELRAGNKGDAEWSSLPTLPHSRSLTLPHRLLDYLHGEQARFSNDTHPKNEGNLYVCASAEEAARIDHWGERLDAWVDTLQRAAANERRWREGGKGGSMLMPALPDATVSAAQQDAASVPVTETNPPSAPRVIEQPAAQARAITPLLIDGIVLAVLCVLIVALAKVLSRYEWISLLIALPWMLYVRRRQ